MNKFELGLSLAKPKRDPTVSTLDQALVAASLFGENRPSLTMGRFTLLKHIGRGGMADVYTAYDAELDREVALKIMRAGREYLASAIHEKQILTLLSTPYVVQAYDAGSIGGRAYIAMEYVGGQSLHRWLRQHTRRYTAWEAVVLRTFIAVGRALHAVHELGIVHGDFKPANVIVCNGRIPKLVDFGLARVFEPTPIGRKTHTGLDIVSSLPVDSIAGTQGYMSPEQREGKLLDARSDQFSFCASLYEVLYGVTPTPETHARAHKPRAELSGAILDAIDRGLAYSPADRFPTMQSLIECLNLNSE